MGKLLRRISIAVCIGLIVWVAAVTVGAQQPQPLVIQGGTLIDGNGGTPVANSVIVIQGNQIAAAGGIFPPVRCVHGLFLAWARSHPAFTISGVKLLPS